MEHDIVNDREQNKTARQGMATQNQQPDWNVNPGTKGPSTNPEDKIALFAVPLPSSKKSDYLCLCKRLFWNVGSSYFTAFCPLSPDETRTLPLASTVVQLVCASPASQTDSTGKKRVPHDLLAYNAQGNIIGVPYLSIHRDTQPRGHQNKGIPYPDISNSAWVPALSVPFVGSPERENKEQLEDVVFIIRNEKHPGDILHQNGNMPMLFSKQTAKKHSQILKEGVCAAEEFVPTSQQPQLGNGLQTKSHDALDSSQKDGLTTLPKDSKQGSPKTRQRPILPCPPKIEPGSKSPVAGQSASPTKANVSATSTSLYRAYNSKWKEQQKESSPTLTVDAMGAKHLDAATPPAPGSTIKTCNVPHEMVLPQIGSVFSLVESSPPGENLPKRITDALLNTTQSDQNKLPSKSQHAEQPVQTALSSKETDDPVLKSRDVEVRNQNKSRSKQNTCGSPMKPSLQQETTYRQSAAAPSVVLQRPMGHWCDTVRQNAPLEQTMQIPAAPASKMQFQQSGAGFQPIRQTNGNNFTGHFTQPNKQSSYMPTCPMQLPQEIGQLGRTRPLHLATSLGSIGILSNEVSSRVPTESFPQPVKTLFNFIGSGQASTLPAIPGHKTKKDKTSSRYPNNALNNSGLTVREILERSRVDHELDLPAVVHLASVPTKLPVIPLARCDGLSPTFKESSSESLVEITPQTDKITTASTTETLQIATKLSGNRGVFSSSVPSPGTSIADSRNVVNGKERVSNHITVESGISRIGSVSKEQLSAQQLSATTVEVPPAPCISQIGMPPTVSIPVGEITVTKNLGLDNVKFVRRLSSTEVVIDGKMPCVILDKINYNLHSVNLSTTQTRNSVKAGIGDTSQSNTDQLMEIDSQLNAPLHEDQNRNVHESQWNSKNPLQKDTASFRHTKKKVKYRGTTLKKPKTTRKPGIKIKRSKSGNSYGSGLNPNIDSSLKDGSQCLTECQSTVSKKKKMQFSGKGSQRYDLNVSKHKPSDDQMWKGYNQDATSINVKTNNVHTTVVQSGVDVEDWSDRTRVKVKGIDIDNLCSWSASSESDFAFSPKRLNPNDSDSDASLEDNTPMYSFSGNLGATETPRFNENFQHMTFQEKVRVLQETKHKQEMALNALKKM